MNTVEAYRKLIENIFSTWQKWPGRDAQIEVIPVTDTENDRYFLITQGWDRVKRIHSLLAHIDIIEGKIWIQEDNTEKGIASDLLAAGVPKDSIVLAFQHTKPRRWSDFALALAALNAR